MANNISSPSISNFKVASVLIVTSALLMGCLSILIISSENAPVYIRHYLLLMIDHLRTGFSNSLYNIDMFKEKIDCAFSSSRKDYCDHQIVRDHLDLLDSLGPLSNVLFLPLLFIYCIKRYKPEAVREPEEPCDCAICKSKPTCDPESKRYTELTSDPGPKCDAEPTYDPKSKFNGDQTCDPKPKYDPEPICDPQPKCDTETKGDAEQTCDTETICGLEQTCDSEKTSEANQKAIALNSASPVSSTHFVPPECTPNPAFASVKVTHGKIIQCNIESIEKCHSESKFNEDPEPICDPEPKCDPEPICDPKSKFNGDQTCDPKPKCDPEPICDPEPKCDTETKDDAEQTCDTETICGLEPTCDSEKTSEANQKAIVLNSASSVSSTHFVPPECTPNPAFASVKVTHGKIIQCNIESIEKCHSESKFNEDPEPVCDPEPKCDPEVTCNTGTKCDLVCPAHGMP